MRLSARSGGLAAAVAVVVLAAAPVAAGHVPRAGKPGDAGVPGMSERQLHRFESAVLGPDHAAEHARMRSLIRFGEAPRAAAPTPRVDPPAATGGGWKPPFNIPVIGINAVMLPTGKVMWFAYPVNANQQYGGPAHGKPAPNTAQAFLWNPATNRFKRIDPPLFRDPYDGKMKPANIWCAGQTLLPDGRLLVAGGNLTYASTGKPFTGLSKVYTFNPWNETWTEQPEMEHGRWYPSVAPTVDGRAVIMSGLNESSAENQYGDTYNPNLGVDLFTPSADLDGRGTIRTLGNRRDLRDHDPGNTNPPDGGLYPHLFWMPSGRLMVAGPDPTDAWFMHAPPGSPPADWLATGWDSIPQNPRRRLWGSGVLVPPQAPGPATKVELLGGTVDESPAANNDASTGNTNTTATFDESGGPWQSGAPMNVNRSHLNTVLLPDGSMVSVGGGKGTTTDKNQWAVAGTETAVDLFHPDTNTWTLGAAQAEARAYHSTAILLPDARVISAGDDLNGGYDRDTAEIYEPPYLFNDEGPAPRPKIDSAPPSARYGESFHVGTTANVAKATLVAPGSATHANDMNQRVVPLEVDAAAGGYDLLPPTDADEAPPGYYMLFLIDDHGVPSVARWIQLGVDPPERGRIEIAQRTEPSSSSSVRFAFGGAPFDGVSLSSGKVAAASLPGGGHYTITQAVSTYQLTSIDCSDGDSTTSVAGRSARVKLAAGEKVRCTFSDRKRPAAKKPSAPGSPSPADRHGPTLRFGRLNARRGTLSGRVSDGSGVNRVEVGLAARRGKRCRWWSKRRRRFARSKRSCARPVLMRARLRRSGSGYTFRLSLHKRVRRGRYLVALKAVDTHGNVTKRSGRSAVRIAVKR